VLEVVCGLVTGDEDQEAVGHCHGLLVDAENAPELPAEYDPVLVKLTHERKSGRMAL
jgi:hypothetical protein